MFSFKTAFWVLWKVEDKKISEIFVKPGLLPPVGSGGRTKSVLRKKVKHNVRKVTK